MDQNLIIDTNRRTGLRRAAKDSKNSKYTDNYIVDFSGKQKQAKLGEFDLTIKQSSSNSRKQVRDSDVVTGGEEVGNKRQLKMARKQEEKAQSIF